MKNMKNYLGKSLGIAGIVGASFLPMKDLMGQDVMTGVYIPTNYSKLSKIQRDSVCRSFYKKIDSVQNERISLYSQSNSYLKKYQENENSRFLELADSLEKSASFYKKLEYGWLKKEADAVGCDFGLKEEKID